MTWVRTRRPDGRHHFAKVSHGDSRPARGNQQAHELDHFAGPGQQFEIPYAGNVRTQIDQLRSCHARASSWSMRPRSISAS